MAAKRSTYNKFLKLYFLKLSPDIIYETIKDLPDTYIWTFLRLPPCSLKDVCIDKLSQTDLTISLPKDHGPINFDYNYDYDDFDYDSDSEPKEPKGENFLSHPYLSTEAQVKEFFNIVPEINPRIVSFQAFGKFHLMFLLEFLEKFKERISERIGFLELSCSSESPLGMALQTKIVLLARTIPNITNIQYGFRSQEVFNLDKVLNQSYNYETTLMHHRKGENNKVIIFPEEAGCLIIEDLTVPNIHIGFKQVNMLNFVNCTDITTTFLTSNFPEILGISRGDPKLPPLVLSEGNLLVPNCVKILYLRNTKLQLVEGYKWPSRLETLTIHNCQISWAKFMKIELPGTLKELEFLENTIDSEVQLFKIPSAVKKLQLSNESTDISNPILFKTYLGNVDTKDTLDSILELQLSHFKLDLQNSFFNFPIILEKVGLTYCNITSLSEIVPFLPETIQELDLSHNEISLIDDSWKKFLKIKVAKFNYNQLTCVRDCYIPSSLETFSASNNKIKKIGINGKGGLFSKNSKKLNEIDLTNNPIEIISSHIEFPTNLKTLKLSHISTKTINLSQFASHDKFKHLEITDSKLKSINFAIHPVTRKSVIEDLDFSGNSIETIGKHTSKKEMQKMLEDAFQRIIVNADNNEEFPNSIIRFKALI
ncbi:uncharacterized protein RJT21DRAFT_4939 [Scheffersomyces amazonensis]|uniref:uncharacterized protein n=1 Tax=Scheffersomyces amazonensis TaxID=1078765 RepID=UPI00315C6107